MSEFRYTVLLLAALGGCYALGYNNGKKYYPNMINRILTSKDFASYISKVVEGLKNEVEKKTADGENNIDNFENEDDGDDDDQINFKA